MLREAVKTNSYLHVQATTLVTLKCRYVIITKAFINVWFANWWAKIYLICCQLLHCTICRLDHDTIVFLGHSVGKVDFVDRLHNHSVIDNDVQDKYKSIVKLEWDSAKRVGLPPPRPLVHKIISLKQTPAKMYAVSRVWFGRTYKPRVVGHHCPLNRNPNPNPNINVTWSRLPPKSNDFFRGPCAIFPSNFVKSVEKFLLYNPVNKQSISQTNK